jgi:hypothetical protein
VAQRPLARRGQCQHRFSKGDDVVLHILGDHCIANAWLALWATFVVDNPVHPLIYRLTQ